MQVVRLPWRLALWSAAAALACGTGFAAVYHLTVRTELGRQLADASFRGALLGQSRTSDLVEAVLGFVSGVSLLLALAFIAFVALVRMQRALGVAAVGLLLAANLSAQLLKGFFLERPDLGVVEYTPATLNSLPSGHTTAAFSVVVALLLVVPPAVRSTVATAGGVYALLNAVATMFAGWHRWADSVAAFLLVGFWAVLALVALSLYEGPPVERPSGDAAVRRWWTVLGMVSFASGLLLTGPIAASDRLRESTLGQVVAFAAGVAFLVAAVIGVLLLVIEAFERLVGDPQARAQEPPEGSWSEPEQA